jgi:hypothetical protein
MIISTTSSGAAARSSAPGSSLCVALFAINSCYIELR